ncbi:hypothetical protein D3C87_1646800 [compost metagenome]
MLRKLLVQLPDPAPPAQNHQQHKSDHGWRQYQREQQHRFNQAVARKPPARHRLGCQGRQQENNDAGYD